MLKTIDFKVTYLLDSIPRFYMTRAENGFEAEIKFLEWAKGLTKPVRVVSVERA